MRRALSPSIVEEIRASSDETGAVLREILRTLEAILAELAKDKRT